MWYLYAGEWIGIGFLTLGSLAIAAFGILNFLRVRNRRLGRKRFRQQRERLEARFFDIAAATGKPRGLRWTDIDFDDAVCFAIDRDKKQLLALVAVTIGFEAIEGGGMEEVEAVSNLRAATAIFHLEGKWWSTNGRVLFNLEPVEALSRLDGVLEQAGD
jgi:hypothetical protein